MRLRQIILALIALSGVWIAVLIQRSHHAPASTLAVGTPTMPKVVHVPGLKRPAAVTPIVRPTPRRHLHPSVPAPVKPAKRVRAHVKAKPAEAPSKTIVIPESTRSYAETPDVPVEPLEISDAQVVDVTASSARITWRTNVPTQSQTAFGLDAPTIWAQPSGQDLIDHESLLSGLEFSTTYQVYLHAVDEWNRAQTTTVTLTTQPMPDRSSARTAGDDIVVDDRPFFATAVWAQCSDGFGSNIDDGINLFMGDGCSKDDSRLAAGLDGRAYSIVNAENTDLDGRGVIGWYYRDEWDAFLPSTLKQSDLGTSIAPPQAGRISFLTLTNHFYSRAAPLPQGKGMYPVLYSIPDVVGFDLYPLQVWCHPSFGDVFDAQHELHDATGKPTFQWIEAAPMEHRCKNDQSLDPTPATVRAETWLAIAGGAGAVGYFPNRWGPEIGGAIAQTNHEIKALAPALLAAGATARSDGDLVRVSARTLNGALYVIAVNTSNATVQAKIGVDGIGGRSVTPLGGGAAIGADDQGFSDTFGPLAARVYVIPPQGW
jgi:hypothetical protein